MTEIKVKKENVLKASEPFRKQLGIPILMGDIYKLLNDLCPEAFEEKKEPEVSELDGLISTFDASEFTEHRVFKQQIIDLAKKKVDECGEVFYGPSSGLMNKYTKGIKQKLEEM